MFRSHLYRDNIFSNQGKKNPETVDIQLEKEKNHTPEDQIEIDQKSNIEETKEDPKKFKKSKKSEKPEEKEFFQKLMKKIDKKIQKIPTKKKSIENSPPESPSTKKTKDFPIKKESKISKQLSKRAIDRFDREFLPSNLSKSKSRLKKLGLEK